MPVAPALHEKSDKKQLEKSNVIKLRVVTKMKTDVG